jgi:AmmeMemoRadiSam system protein A
MNTNVPDPANGTGEASKSDLDAPPSPSFSPDERRWLLRLARQTLAGATAGDPDPEPAPAWLTPSLLQPRACFVTLTQGGSLRGCIGHLVPKDPLWKAVIENARCAAFHDPRFPPVSASELGQIEIEISVLTEPQPLAFGSPEDLLAKLQPGRDGVVLESGWQRATFLPQVWEELPDKLLFLGRLCLKGGWDEHAWREPGLKVSLYQVEAFHEAELPDG